MNTNRINADEQEAILTVVKRVYQNIKTRCHQNGAAEDEISASLYSIQDFLGSIDTNQDAEKNNFGQ